MSIELAVAWACRTLRIQQAADDAAHMFEQAARDDKRATILVSGQLSKDGKGWLARWTGSEVVVAELTQRQQAGLGLKPGAMSQHLERVIDSSAPSLRHDLTLADVILDDRWVEPGLTESEDRNNLADYKLLVYNRAVTFRN